MWNSLGRPVSSLIIRLQITLGWILQITFSSALRAKKGVSLNCEKSASFFSFVTPNRYRKAFYRLNFKADKPLPSATSQFQRVAERLQTEEYFD